MGLFEKKIKKPTDLDDDVVPLTTPAAKSAPVATTPVETKPEHKPEPRPEPKPAPAAAKDHPDYGINKAIELMRLLPDENVELIVRVVKTTLESTNINIASIIKDAARKEQTIEGRVDVLKKEIAGLEAEIATRKSEIHVLEADHKETTMVKERLLLAEKLAAGGHQDPRPPVVPRQKTPTGIPLPARPVDPNRTT